MRVAAAGYWRSMRKELVSSALYFLTLIPAIFGVVFVLTAMESGGFLSRLVAPLYSYDSLTPATDEIALVAVLAVGGLVFGVSGWMLVLFERLRRPGLVDHLRRCAGLYLAFIVLTITLIPEYVEMFGVSGYSGPEFQVQIIWLLAICAILLDAFMLAWKRRRHDRVVVDIGS